MPTLAIPRVTEILDEQDPQADDERYWSVTAILSNIAKHALVPWAAKMTAEEAVASEITWRSMVQSGKVNEAIKYLSAARYRPPPGCELEADTLGSAVHHACEHYALWGARPELVHAEVIPFLDQFDRWLQRFQPTYEAAEVVVYDPRYRYAGTADTILTIPEQADADAYTALVDYKTSREPLDSQGRPKRPYTETVLQLAAYRYAELAAIWRVRRMTYYKRRYYLLSPGERALAVPVPEVDGAGCMLITPQSCELFPMRADRGAFQAFLHVLEVSRYMMAESKGAIGEPVVPPMPGPDGDEGDE